MFHGVGTDSSRRRAPPHAPNHGGENAAQGVDVQILPGSDLKLGSCADRYLLCACDVIDVGSSSPAQRYNHHHNAYLNGAAARLVDVGPAGSDKSPGHGGGRSRWENREISAELAGVAMATTTTTTIGGPPQKQVPVGAFIVDGNGGEYV